MLALAESSGFFDVRCLRAKQEAHVVVLSAPLRADFDQTGANHLQRTFAVSKGGPRDHSASLNPRNGLLRGNENSASRFLP
jgi:hypothetical protein